MTTIWYDDSRGVRRTPIVQRIKGQIYVGGSHISTYPQHIQDEARAALQAAERAVQ